MSELEASLVYKAGSKTARDVNTEKTYLERILKDVIFPPPRSYSFRIQSPLGGQIPNRSILNLFYVVHSYVCSKGLLEYYDVTRFLCTCATVEKEGGREHGYG